MDMKALYEEIRSAAFTTRRAIANTAAPMSYVERMKNILYNRMDEIEDALKYAAEAADKIIVLETELDDAEREITEKEQIIKELSEKKTTKQKKSTGPNNG